VEGFWRLYTDDFYEIRLPVPPSDEQRLIVDKLAEMTAPVRRSTEVTERQIRTASEFRSRFIAEIVTGKLDVREAAARLPDELIQAEPLDGIPAIDRDVDVELEAAPEEAEA
jgi:type I restriction enzyme S subunit